MSLCLPAYRLTARPNRLTTSTDANSGFKIASELSHDQASQPALKMLKLLQWPSWRLAVHESQSSVTDLTDTNAHMNTRFVSVTNTVLHTDTVKSMKWSVYIIKFNKMTCMEKWEKSVYKADLRQLPCWILWLTKHLSTQYLVLMFRLKHNNSRLVEDNLICKWIMLLLGEEFKKKYFDNKRERESSTYIEQSV